MGLHQRVACIWIRPPLHPSHVSFADGRERLFVVLGNFCQLFEDFCVPLELCLDSLRIYIRRLDVDDDVDDDNDGTMIACDDMPVVTLDGLRAVGMKMTVFFDVTPCSFVDGTDVSKGLAASVLYRGADKSVARPGSKQARKHVRDARDFNNIETRSIIKFPPPCKTRRRRKFTSFWQKH